jgi:pimeloyl-ACP methyl ester carboxylesterase
MASVARTLAGTTKGPVAGREQRAALGRLIPDWNEARRRGLRARTCRGAAMPLWDHGFEEILLTDGPGWELPAWILASPGTVRRGLVFFDDRGRWESLQRWGWLARAAGMFAPEDGGRAVVSVDLPGWGDTRPRPSGFDLVSWGGVDRWSGYVSAATGASVMALRLRDAVRTLDFVQRRWRLPAGALIVGGHGLGGTIAGLAGALHGRVGGVVLIEPLAALADLATTRDAAWPHDAYFPGILGASDLPAALAGLDAPTWVVGPRDGRGQLLGARARRLFRGRRVQVRPGEFAAAEESALLQWLSSRTPARR